MACSKRRGRLIVWHALAWRHLWRWRPTLCALLHTKCCRGSVPVTLLLLAYDDDASRGGGILYGGGCIYGGRVRAGVNAATTPA